MPTVGIPFFGPLNPFHYSSLPLYLPPHFSTAFGTHPCILYLHIFILCVITDALSFSFPSFPKFHRGVPQLQTCSTSEFVYDHANFCVCLSLDLSSTYERKCGLCVSEPGLLHLTWCPPIISLYLQTTCHYSLRLSKTSLCIYTTFS
jgi:hypothetical protein